MRKALTTTLIALLATISLQATTLTGRVVRVADGDTLTLLTTDNAQHKVRLHGIDAPEKKQAYGDASRKALAERVAGKQVRVEWTARDKYQRILGVVYADGKDINLAMLQMGYAWHYKRFDNNPVYAQAEAEARAQKRGLWRDASPTPPWDFRKAKK